MEDMAERDGPQVEKAGLLPLAAEGSARDLLASADDVVPRLGGKPAKVALAAAAALLAVAALTVLIAGRAGGRLAVDEGALAKDYTQDFDCDAGFENSGLDNWRDSWSDAKMDYCCEHAGRGCRFPHVDHDVQYASAHPRHGTPAYHGAGASPYDCDAGLERDWSVPKRNYCCQVNHRACHGYHPETYVSGGSRHVAYHGHSEPAYHGHSEAVYHGHGEAVHHHARVEYQDHHSEQERMVYNPATAAPSSASSGAAASSASSGYHPQYVEPPPSRDQGPLKIASLDFSAPRHDAYVTSNGAPAETHRAYLCNYGVGDKVSVHAGEYEGLGWQAATVLGPSGDGYEVMIEDTGVQRVFDCQDIQWKGKFGVPVWVAMLSVLSAMALCIGLGSACGCAEKHFDWRRPAPGH